MENAIHKLQVKPLMDDQIMKAKLRGGKTVGFKEMIA